VQILTYRQRILKEIWIHGVAAASVKKDSYRSWSELEAKGKEYEIF